MMLRRLDCVRSWPAIAALLAFTAAAPLWAAEAPQDQPALQTPAIERTMAGLPDGRRLQLSCVGVGEPTVILDAGLGLDSSVWMRVLPSLAAVTRTCAYDRAGYGGSDPGPFPRDVANRTADLLALLDGFSEGGSFVIVGHSAAELTARLAAGRRPDMVVGLVLVDPGPDLDALRSVGPVWAAAHDAAQSAASKCIRATADGEMRPGQAIYVECGSPPTEGPLASRDMAAAVLSENEPEPSVRSAITPGSLGDTQVIVLTAEDKFGSSEGSASDEIRPLRQVWLQRGAAIAGASSRGEQRLVAGASHVIQIQRPQAVIDAVTEVVDRVRADGAARKSGS